MFVDGLDLTEEQLRERGILRSVKEMVAEAERMVALSVSSMPVGCGACEPSRELTGGRRGGALGGRVGSSGLLYASSMHANQPAVALYERAIETMPPRPEVHVPLSHPGLDGGLENIAEELGYDLV